MLEETLQPVRGARYLDLGCGEGTVGRRVGEHGSSVVGCDSSAGLLARLDGFPAVLARLPDLGWVRPASFDGAYAVLVLEHLQDAADLFTSVRRCVLPGGVLAVVVNHPVFTAPGAGPVISAEGEALWQWGTYLLEGITREPAGDHRVEFHHRPLGMLLAAAARGGWVLRTLAEQPGGLAGAARDPVLASQRHIPRLAGIRWTAA